MADIPPFRRLIVYNSIRGTTYVYWEIRPDFVDTGTYTYQLQVNRTPAPDDTEWSNIGTPVVDAPFLTDSSTESYGLVLDKYYRVILTTDQGTYVSPPEGCFGQLKPREFRIAKEIVRKEWLLHRYTAVPITILKKKRYGERCPHCATTGGSNNSACPYCYGTGYLGGYHTPYHMQVMTISPSKLREIHTSDNVMTVNTAVDRYQARALGVPELFSGDIIVDEATGQRFRISAAPVAAQMHRVPLIRQVDMGLLPYSDTAYSIETNGSEVITDIERTIEGCGHFLLNQEFNNNSLVYSDANHQPILGASVVINSGDTVIGTTTTGVDGIWDTWFMLDPGTYAVTFSKLPEYGPDTETITIEPSQLTEDAQDALEFEVSKESINYINPFG